MGPDRAKLLAAGLPGVQERCDMAVVYITSAEGVEHALAAARAAIA